MGMIMFYVTYPDESSAKSLTDHLLNERLVACANIYPMNSIYPWKGNIEKSSEYSVIYKTSYKNISKIETTIEKLHPYEVPCILHWEFSCNIGYERWLRSNIEE